ncbi:MAG: InlB B-repeat-containing protein, partial [Clostridia bacterium]|nr:InlB B-repeat-containing protein [Clostridia bacterium]
MANTKNARHEKDNRLNSWGTTCRGDSDGMTAMQKKTRRGTARFGRAVDPHAIQEDCRTVARERESMQERSTSGGAVCARRVGGHAWLKVLVFVLLFAVVFGVCFGVTSEGMALANSANTVVVTRDEFYVYNQVSGQTIDSDTIELNLNDANAPTGHISDYFSYGWNYKGDEISMNIESASNGVHFYQSDSCFASEILYVDGLINVKTPAAIYDLIDAGLVESAKFTATFKVNNGDNQSFGVALTSGPSKTTGTIGFSGSKTTLKTEGNTATISATLADFGDGFEYFYCQTASEMTGVLPFGRSVNYNIYGMTLEFTLNSIPSIKVGIPRATTSGAAAQWSSIKTGLRYAYSASEEPYIDMTMTSEGSWTTLYFKTGTGGASDGTGILDYYIASSAPSGYDTKGLRYTASEPTLTAYSESGTECTGNKVRIILKDFHPSTGKYKPGVYFYASYKPKQYTLTLKEENLDMNFQSVTGYTRSISGTTSTLTKKIYYDNQFVLPKGNVLFASPGSFASWTATGAISGSFGDNFTIPGDEITGNITMTAGFNSYGVKNPQNGSDCFYDVWPEGTGDDDYSGDLASGTTTGGQFTVYFEDEADTHYKKATITYIALPNQSGDVTYSYTLKSVHLYFVEGPLKGKTVEASVVDYTATARYVSGRFFVYSSWESNNKTQYTITFDPNGGTLCKPNGNTTNKDTYKIKYIKGMSISHAYFPYATRSGYVFCGWTKSDGTLKMSVGSSDTGSYTLTALWATAKLSGGTLSGESTYANKNRGLSYDTSEKTFAWSGTDYNNIKNMYSNYRSYYTVEYKRIVGAVDTYAQIYMAQPTTSVYETRAYYTVSWSTSAYCQSWVHEDDGRKAGISSTYKETDNTNWIGWGDHWWWVSNSAAESYIDSSWQTFSGSVTKTTAKKVGSSVTGDGGGSGTSKSGKNNYASWSDMTVYSEFRVRRTGGTSGDASSYITYSRNSGTNATIQISKTDNAYLPKGSFWAVTGKYFLGWSTGSEGAVLSGAKAASGGTTYHAIWKDAHYQVNSWDVYVGEDGGGVKLVRAPQVRPHGTALTLSGLDPSGPPNSLDPDEITASNPTVGFSEDGWFKNVDLTLAIPAFSNAASQTATTAEFTTEYYLKHKLDWVKSADSDDVTLTAYATQSVNYGTAYSLNGAIEFTHDLVNHVHVYGDAATADGIRITWKKDGANYAFKSSNAEHYNCLLYVDEGNYYNLNPGIPETDANYQEQFTTIYTPNIAVRYTLKGTQLLTEKASSVKVTPLILPIRLRAEYNQSRERSKVYDSKEANLDGLLVPQVESGDAAVFAAEYNKANSYFGSAYPGLQLSTAAYTFVKYEADFVTGDTGYDDTKTLNAGRYTVHDLLLKQYGKELVNKNYVWSSMVTENPDDNSTWQNLTTDTISYEIYPAPAHIYVWSARREYSTDSSDMEVVVDNVGLNSDTANFTDYNQHVSVTGLVEDWEWPTETKSGHNNVQDLIASFAGAFSNTSTASSDAGFYDLVFDLSELMDLYRNN